MSEVMDFDEASVSLEAIEKMKLGVAIDSAYIQGARRQHAQSQDKLSTLKAKLEKAEAALELYATAPCHEKILEVAPRFREPAIEALKEIRD